jgi:Putative zinc- or iron-chelating domain
MNQKRNLGRKTSSASNALSAEGLEWEARREQRLETVQTLRSGRTSLQVIALAQDASDRAERGMQTTLAQHPPRPPLACTEGCAWCCRKVVGCAAPEVLHIAAYLQEHLSPEQMEATRQRVIERDGERRSLRQDSWAAKRVACPLLVDERCCVYPVRPLTCRGFNSTDARACERSVKSREHVDVPTHAPPHRLATFVLDGLRSGLGEAGLSGDLLELTAALRVALALPDAAQQWLAGQPIFAGARLN